MLLKLEKYEIGATNVQKIIVSVLLALPWHVLANKSMEPAV